MTATCWELEDNSAIQLHTAVSVASSPLSLLLEVSASNASTCHHITQVSNNTSHITHAYMQEIKSMECTNHAN
jgi:hypothetical protein